MPLRLRARGGGAERARRRGARLIVVGAHADAGLDLLARGVGAARVVGRLLVEDGGGGRADERAVVLVRRGVLEGALRGGGDAGRHVGGARLDDRGAGRRAEVAVDAGDRDLDLVRLAAARGVLVVRGGRGAGGRRRRGGRRRAGGLDAGREGGLRGDAAHVLAADHADVAILAPGGAPRVLHLPVVLAVRAVADGEDAVVELLAAAGRVEDAR